MNEHDPNAAPGASAKVPPDVVPRGYRPGIITAITLFLAFSLAFCATGVSRRPARGTGIRFFPSA